VQQGGVQGQEHAEQLLVILASALQLWRKGGIMMNVVLHDQLIRELEVRSVADLLDEAARREAVHQ